MLEFFIFVILALHGLACTTILTLIVWRAARSRDTRAARDGMAVDRELSTALAPRLPASRSPAEILPIMAEHFPREYERYRRGELPHPAREELWATCCAIQDARAEIEELCS